MGYVEVSAQAQQELLRVMAENDSEIVPAELFEIIVNKYPLKDEG
jgi:hypothetical protein